MFVLSNADTTMMCSGILFILGLFRNKKLVYENIFFLLWNDFFKSL